MAVENPDLGRAISQLKASSLPDTKLPIRLQLSMFRKQSTGAFVTAAVHWAYESDINQIEFQVADTLYRHNLRWQEQLTPEAAGARATKLGDDWLTANQPAIAWSLKPFDDVRLTRWDYWRRHVSFPDSIASVDDLRETDQAFANAVDNDVTAYFNRIGRSYTPARADAARTFIHEEIAVSDVAARDEPANEIYAGHRITAEAYIAQMKLAQFAIPRVPFIELSF